MPIEITRRSVRQARWLARAPRIAVVAACAVLTAAGLRTVLTAARAGSTQAAPPSERRAATHQPEQALAEAFANTYLTWDSNAPTSRLAELSVYAPQVAEDLRSDRSSAPRGRQSVRWTAVLRDEAATNGGRRITILARTTTGLTALAVTVKRGADGALAISGYPAIVGIPAASKDNPDSAGDPVDDAAVSSMVNRALRNFLAARRDALVADLVPGAVITVPATRLRASNTPELAWVTPQRVVEAVVHTRLPEGGELTLAYDLGVVRQAGRWFVQWIENQPTGGMS